MKQVILDEDDLAEKSAIFTGKIGRILATLFLTIFGVTRVNRVYSELCHLRGTDFTTAWLRYTGVSYTITNESHLNNLPDGAFITISNHPFGGVDGIMLVDILGKRRPDYKFMVNSVLLHVQTLSEQFVGVKPTTPKSGSSVENTAGLKQTLRHIKSGGAMGFFPAGAVAGYYENPKKITEKEWQPTIIRLIQAAQVPVLPIYIHGRNSWYFYLLGRIHWQLRTTRLAHEVLNKRGKTIRVTVGKPIETAELKQYETLEELGQFLKMRTESLASQ